MAGDLIVQFVRDNHPTEIGRLTLGEVFIGREPGEGIAVPAGAVSRQHGIFIRLRNTWLYKDLDSTNGSWVNGEQVYAGDMRIVRAGDILQLADAAIRLAQPDPSSGTYDTMSGVAGGGVKSLLVFARGNFLEEYPVPQYGRALSIGGAKADLVLDSNVGDLPSLVVEGRGASVVAFALSPTATFSVGAKVFQPNQTYSLQDREIITIAYYTILFSDPAQALEQGAPMPVMEPVPQSERGDLGGLSEEDTRRIAMRKSIPQSAFGQPMPERSHDETVSIDSGSLMGKGNVFDRHPSMRHMEEEPTIGSNESIEDKIIVLIGVILLAAILVLLLWWALL